MGRFNNELKLIMSKKAFDVNNSVTSSETISVSSGAFLVQQEYTTTGFTRLYLNDNAIKGTDVTDISGYAIGMYSNSVTPGSKFPWNASDPVTGRCIEFNGTSSYIRVDTVEGIQDYKDFTIKALVYPDSVASESTLFCSSRDAYSPYRLYIDSGYVKFQWKDLSGVTTTKTGHAISDNELSALYLSFGESEIVFKKSGQSDISFTGSNHYLRHTNEPIYVGGDGDSKDNYFDGFLGKVQYEKVALGSTTSFTVSSLYDVSVPYITSTASIDANYVPYRVDISKYNDSRNCSLAYLISTNSGSTWLTNTSSSWASTDGISDYCDLGHINAILDQLTCGSSTELSLRVFLKSDGTDGGGILSSSISYIYDNSVTSFDNPDVTFGTTENIFNSGYVSSSIRPGDVPIIFIGDSISGPFTTYSPSISFSGYDDRNSMIRDLEVSFDGQFCSSDLIISTSADSVEKYLFLSIGDNAGVPYSDSGGSTVSIRGHYVTISSYANTGVYDSPTLSVFDISRVDPISIIDSYKSTSSGPIEVSLPSGSYKFELIQEDGGVFTISKTISSDDQFSINSLPPKRSSSQPLISINIIDVIVDQLSCVKGDTPTISLYIVDKKTRIPKDITDFNVFFRLKEAYGDTVIVDRQCSNIQPSYGKCSVQLTSDDTNTNGKFIGELKLIKISGSEEVITSLPRFIFYINDSF